MLNTLDVKNRVMFIRRPIYYPATGFRSALDELDISVTGNTLSISGERKIADEGETVRYHRREREAGTFSRIISLPGEVNADKIEAELKNGILKIHIPKAEKAKPKQIAVR